MRVHYVPVSGYQNAGNIFIDYFLSYTSSINSLEIVRIVQDLIKKRVMIFRSLMDVSVTRHESTTFLFLALKPLSHYNLCTETKYR